MDDTNEETQESKYTDQQFRFQNPVANMNSAESSVPSVEEMLAAISESAELTRNLQALMESENSHNSTVAQFDSTTLPAMNSPSGSRTTNLTCYDENLKPFNISLQHQDSIKFNVEVKDCENVVVGDRATLNTCCGQKGQSNGNRRHRSNGSTENNSLVQADGEINPSGPSTREWKQRMPPKNSVKKSATKKNLDEKFKTKWRFPMFLSDFTDAESLNNDIGQWLAELISYLLSKAQDLDDFEPVIELIEEAKKLRKHDVPGCLQKLNNAIQRMSALDRTEESKNYFLLTETQFVLAEFYTVEENFVSALQFLKKLEGSLFEDAEKSRLYAKIAKVMEHCLEFSVDITSCENDLDGASSTPVSNRNADEIVICYYEKALNFSNKELLLEKREVIQRCCYLGKAAVLLRSWKGQVENARKLAEVIRENLLSTEKLFNRISPAMKCQFYVAEAFLLYYEGRYKMAADKIRTAYQIADAENFLERKCLGSKRLHFLLAELDKNTADVSTLEAQEEVI